MPSSNVVLTLRIAQALRLQRAESTTRAAMHEHKHITRSSTTHAGMYVSSNNVLVLQPRRVGHRLPKRKRHRIQGR
jgi:hypothetical protein